MRSRKGSVAGSATLFLATALLLVGAPVAHAGPASDIRQEPPCTREPYWQQSVGHEIEVRLDKENDDLVGHLILDYENHSPDTLTSLYFHLFQNAFRKGSHRDDDNRSGRDFRLSNLEPSQEGGTEVDHVQDGSGRPLGVRIFDTIMEVTLVDPLAPGDSVQISMDFTTHYGKVRGRMKRLNGLGPGRSVEDRHYQATQWYPRIAVYDQRRGWNIDQHIGQEFYGEYGSFDVTITVPGRYIVAATGLLQNPLEVMPDNRREAIDLRWYAPGVDPDERPEVPDPPDSVLTWHFHADDVHDFAWVTDPTFRIGETEWDGIKVYSYVRERNAAGWQDADSICAEFLRFFSERVGRYVWPQHSVVDASSGMEYPMVSMDSGSSPGYYGLIGHELAHNWFQGAVGSNETYAAVLDEGCTNFITAWACDSIFGPPESSGTFWERGNWYERNFYPDASRLYTRNIRRYVNYSHSGYMDDLFLHSHWHKEYRSYRQVYFKATMMLHALRLVLGDDVFEQAFRQYYSCWKLRHPYPEDFIAVMENVSGRQLDWFFDQWLHTERVVDYAIDGVEGAWIETPSGERGYEARVTIERKGDLFMPVDLDLLLEDGSTFRAHIPVDRGAKMEPGRKVLPVWDGWGSVRKTYTAQLLLPSKPVEAHIDGGGNLADIDGRDNHWRPGLLSQLQPFGRTRFLWDNLMLHFESPDHYDVLWRPSLGYTDPSGVWLGVHLRGSYLDQFWTRFNQLRVVPRVGLRDGRLGYELTYDTPVRWLGRLSRWYLKSAIVDGRSWQEIGLRKTFRRRLTEGPEARAEIALRSRQVIDRDDLAPGLRWNGEINNSLVMSYEFRPWLPLSPYGNLFFETTLGGSTPHATRIQGEARGRFRFAGVTFVPRGFAGYVTHSRTRGPALAAVPRDLLPWLYSPSRGTTMDLFEDYFYRVDGALPDAWWQDGRIIHPRGPFMRGFGDAGILANRVWSASLDMKIRPVLDGLLGDIGLSSLRRWLHLDVSLYYELGNIALRDDNDFLFSDDPLQSAGVTWRWRAPVPIPGLHQETLWLHLPLWTDDPIGLRSSDDGWKLRWAIGLGGVAPQPMIRP